MNRLARSLVLSAAVAATTLLPVMEASADHRWREHQRRHYVKRDRDGDLVAAGILGLVAGALVVGTISAAENPPPVRYRYDDYRYRDRDYFPSAPARTYARPRVVYADEGYGAEPWSAAWYRYCESRYRSFNPDTGTFRGYDGRDHFCIAR